MLQHFDEVLHDDLERLTDGGRDRQFVDVSAILESTMHILRQSIGHGKADELVGCLRFGPLSHA